MAFVEASKLLPPLADAREGRLYCAQPRTKRKLMRSRGGFDSTLKLLLALLGGAALTRMDR